VKRSSAGTHQNTGVAERRLRGRRGAFDQTASPSISVGAGFMVVVLSLLFIAFIFGIWMGLWCYRQSTVKVSTDNAIVPRHTKSRTHTYRG
jgi:hypothetical protein